MAMKWCTKLDVAEDRCSIVFQGHPSYFKVTRDKKSPILTRIGRFWTVTPVWIHWWLCKAWRSVEEVPYCFLRSSIKFEDHPGPENCRFESNLINITRPVTAIKSLRLALFFKAATKQLYEWFCPSVRLSVTTFSLFVSSYHHEIFRSNYHWQKWCPCKKSRSEVKRQGQRDQKNF